MKETSPAEITWCLKNPKAQAVPSVLPVCQGQGAIPATAPGTGAPSTAGCGAIRAEGTKCQRWKGNLAEESTERNTKLYCRLWHFCFRRTLF